MWYVIQVLGGKERYVKMLIERLADNNTLQECFIPQSEIMKRYKGEWRKCTEVLFPGYLFLVTEDVGKSAAELRKIPAFAKLLGNNEKFIPLNPNEIALIAAFTEAGHRIIEMSEGIIEGDRVIIFKGPLKSYGGVIKKINRHKRLAYLEVRMLGRTTNIRVGLEIVRKRV